MGYKAIEQDEVTNDGFGEVSRWSGFLERVGSREIFAYKLTRLVATLALIGCVVYTMGDHAWNTFDLVVSATLVCSFHRDAFTHTYHALALRHPLGTL